MKRIYKLCLFDLDGVIIDSKKNMERSWEAIQAVFDIDIPFSKYFQFIGRPFYDILMLLDLGTRAKSIKKVYDVSSAERLDLINAYDGFPETIRGIKQKGIKIGIVTSKDEERTLAIVKKLNILFDVIECPNDQYRGKPHPDPLLRAILKCKCDPSETLYIGDMEVDYESAKRAGVDYLHADWGYGDYANDMNRVFHPNEIQMIFEDENIADDLKSD